MINPGVQTLIIKEATSGSGVTSREGTIQSDAVLCTLWVNSISGTLLVDVYSVMDTGKEVLLFSFPIQSAASTELLVAKSESAPSKFRVQATYTGACDYEIHARSLYLGRLAQSDIDAIAEAVGSGDTGVFGDNINNIREAIVINGTGVLIITDPAIVSIENDNPARQMTIYTGSTTEFS